MKNLDNYLNNSGKLIFLAKRKKEVQNLNGQDWLSAIGTDKYSTSRPICKNKASAFISKLGLGHLRPFRILTKLQ